MITFTRRSLALLPAIAPLLSAELARAIELNPAAVAFQTSDQIKWSPPSPAGARNAVLVGDPTKEGLYVQMVKWLGGDHFSRPHFRPNDRFITVIGGTWWVGTGTKFDPEATLPMGPGRFRYAFWQTGPLRRRQRGRRNAPHRRPRSGDLNAGRSEVSFGSLR